MDKLDKKNATNDVPRNLDGNGSGGFFASLGGCDTHTAPKGTRSAVLEYLRERLRAANTKELLRATELSAPSGSNASGITRLSKRAHKEVLNDESHVTLQHLGYSSVSLMHYNYVKQVDVLPLLLGLDRTL